MGGSSEPYAGQGGGQGHRATGEGADAVAAAGAGMLKLHEEAAALKRLLLQEADVVSLLGAALLLLHNNPRWDAEHLLHLAGACCAVAALCPDEPDEVRAAARPAPLPPVLQPRPPQPQPQLHAKSKDKGRYGVD